MVKEPYKRDIKTTTMSSYNLYIYGKPDKIQNKLIRNNL